MERCNPRNPRKAKMVTPLSRGRLLSRPIRGSSALLTLIFWTFIFQNHEVIHFCLTTFFMVPGYSNFQKLTNKKCIH